MKLLAVNVGRPTEIVDERTGRATLTGIRKLRVPGATVRVAELNIEGDGQADLENHGGVDKAVYAYTHDHLPAWVAEIGYGVGIDAPFGENLSVSGLTERDVRIGDRWQWGEVMLEIAQPRWPCFKLGLHAGRRDLPALLIDRERSGWYSRVIVPGDAPASGELRLLHRDEEAPTVLETFQAAKRLLAAGRATEIAACPALAVRWRKMIERRYATAEVES